VFFSLQRYMHLSPAASAPRGAISLPKTVDPVTFSEIE
ncbi:uncharacterized protein METZ01_LOCUS101470, partial [marine metagenome]